MRKKHMKERQTDKTTELGSVSTEASYEGNVSKFLNLLSPIQVGF